MAQVMPQRFLKRSMSRDEYEAGFSLSEFGIVEAREICRQLALHDEPERLVDGTNLVFRVGKDQWLKFYSPLWPEEFGVELQVLKHVAAQLPIRTPEILAKGELDGWSFLLLSHVHGTPFGTIQAELTLNDRVTIAHQLGEAMAALHAAPTELLSDRASDWEAFLEKQIDTVVHRVASSGAGGAWITRVEAWIAERADSLRGDVDRVVIHGDLYFAHVLLRRSGSGWELAGIIDFADARVAPSEFDCVDPVLWLFRGDRDPLIAFFRAIGIVETAIDAQMAERILTWSLVHGFVRFADAFEQELRDGIGTMEALARRICPVG